MHWILKVAFFFSGATGLMYEIVWGRMLATVIGSTVLSASIVMGVFMGGLALGARFFGSWGDNISFPLKMYSFLEAALGLSALGVSIAIPHLHQWWPGLFHLTAGGDVWALRTGIAAIFLLPPTMLMGGTLPVLSRYVVKNPQHLGNPVGTLYGLNTLGACTGCLFSGFYAIESLGLLGTVYLSVGINLGIFFCCFFLFSEASSASALPQNRVHPAVNTPEYGKTPSPNAPPRGFLFAYALSGATGLAYEVLWIRLLANTFIGTSYGFAAMLGTCLTGMALGSLSFRKKADETLKPFLWFGGIQLGLAFWAQSLLLLYNAFPALQNMMSRHLGVSLGIQVLEMLTYSGVLILAPSFLLGALFPLANRIWAGGRTGIGANVGKLYTSNTLGCVAGSLAAGLLLLPNFGVQNSLAFLGAVNCGLALYSIGVSKLSVPKKYQIVAMSLGALALLVFLVPGNLTARAMAHKLRKPWRLLYYDEGLDSNIMILQYKQSGMRRLMTSYFQYIGDTSKIMTRIQKLQAHLPILLEGSPQKILFVGMGTGITPGAATAYPADITCCEISPGVMAASQFFSPENKDILHNPRVTLVQEDGRHYLLQSNESFDLIVGDLYNAALAGMGNLYSKEYYSLCLSRLRKKGMMCQWISMKDLPEKELKGVMATFSNVFPHTSLWCATPDILAMIGTIDSLQADMKKIQGIMDSPDLQDALQEIGMDHPLFLLEHFLMNQEAWNAFTAGAPVITDDRPYIEYSIPRSLHYLRYKKDMPATLRRVNAGRTFLIPPGKTPLNSYEENVDRISRAESHLFEGYAAFLEDHFATAREEYQKTLSLNPWDMDAKLLQNILE
jgi:spermidine synthase